MTALDGLARREVRRFRRSPFGPITVTGDGHEVRAVAPDGTTARAAAGVEPGGSADEVAARLADGIEVLVRDRPFARLHRRGAGASRASRAVLVDAVEPDAVPDGARFRLRGWDLVVLETPGRSLVRPPRLVPWGLSGTLVTADDVTADVVLLYALVACSHGLSAPLRLLT